MQTLLEFAEDCYFLGRDIRPSTKAFYRVKIKLFSAWLGREATLEDLNDRTINKFLAHRVETAARDTVRGERSTLVALWQFAYDDRRLETPPGRVRPLKRIPKIVDGWSESQLATLLATIEQKPGLFRYAAVRRSAYWRAVVLTLYDTGLRLGDLLNLTLDQVTKTRFVVVQSKTRKPVDIPLSQNALEAIRAIRSHTRPKPFGDVVKRRTFFQEFAAICKAAGLVGRTKKLRITSGSMVEADYPGEGHLHLGNGKQVFDTYYHWREVTKRPTRLPPRLSG